MLVAGVIPHCNQVSTNLGETREQQFLQPTEVSDRLSVIKPAAFTNILLLYSFLVAKI